MIARLRSLPERLRSLSERWRWLGLALAVQKRFGEVRGGEFSSAITLSLFLSLFPLLLLAIAVLGFFSAGGRDIAGQVVEELGLSGEAARIVTDGVAAAERSRRAASLLGLVGLLWAALGLVAVVQNAYNSVWQVTGRGIRDKLVGLAWLAGAGLLFALSFAVTAVLRVLPAFLAPLAVFAGVGVSLALLLWSSKLLPNRDLPWRALLPGALAGAVGLEVLKALGSLYVPRAVASSSALYGSIGVVFALLAWLFFFARLLIYSAVLNVVLWERRHGTESIEVEVPRLPDRISLSGTRGGQASIEAAADRDVETIAGP